MTRPMQMTTRESRTIIPYNHPAEAAWQVARLTELLLMRHSWRQVQNIMNITKTKFDQILDAALDKTWDEQEKAERKFEAEE